MTCLLPKVSQCCIGSTAAMAFCLLTAGLTAATAALSVNLAWDANPAGNIAGYRVHYGTSSGNYTQTSDVGKATTASISNLTPGQTYYFAATDYDTSGRESQPSNQVSFTATAAGTMSLFNPGTTPSTVTENDPNPVELGLKFSASQGGKITAIRFYKGPKNTGTHTAHLWNTSGTSLASATFSRESATGWQQVNLSSPVSITAGRTYIVSYHTKGYYSVNENYFVNSRTNGSLTAPASASSSGNDVYAYGSGTSFPTNTYYASNYWVDVVFAPGP